MGCSDFANLPPRDHPAANLHTRGSSSAGRSDSPSSLSEEKVNPLGRPWRSSFAFDLQGVSFLDLSPEDGLMLVLARKCGEQIVIPEAGIVLTILQVSGERVRVGIDAPAELSVHRREVWERIQNANEPDVLPATPVTPCSSI